jgi:putative ABC transport system permease protein
VLSGFALLALLLAALGIFGVVSQSVMERTNEIGIRMALGAHPGQLRSMVILQGLRIGGAGLALGIISSLAFLRGLSSLLYGVTPAIPCAIRLIRSEP